MADSSASRSVFWRTLFMTNLFFRAVAEEEKIKAVFDEEIEEVLRKIGKLDDIKNGEVLCSECGIQVSVESIQIILPLGDGTWDFVCNGIECVRSYLGKQRCG
jgi:hypothetical protein